MLKLFGSWRVVFSITVDHVTTTCTKIYLTTKLKLTTCDINYYFCKTWKLCVTLNKQWSLWKVISLGQTQTGGPKLIIYCTQYQIVLRIIYKDENPLTSQSLVFGDTVLLYCVAYPDEILYKFVVCSKLRIRAEQSQVLFCVRYELLGLHWCCK